MPTDDMEAREDVLAEAYRVWLSELDDSCLAIKAFRLLSKWEDNNPIRYLGDKERKVLVDIVLELNSTGKGDPWFEDVRNSL